MKTLMKALYLLPAVLVTALFCFVGFVFEEMSPLGWVYPLLYWIAAMLLLKGKWWGCAAGIAASFLITKGFRPNQSAPDYVLQMYYLLMGAGCAYLNRRT